MDLNTLPASFEAEPTNNWKRTEAYLTYLLCSLGKTTTLVARATPHSEEKIGAFLVLHFPSLPRKANNAK